MKKIKLAILLFIFTIILVGCRKTEYVKVNFLLDGLKVKEETINKGEVILKPDFKQQIFKNNLNPKDVDDFFYNNREFNFSDEILTNIEINLCFHQNKHLEYIEGNKTVIIKRLNSISEDDTITIYNYHRGKKVVKIKQDAFKNCDKLKKVFLPKHLTIEENNEIALEFFKTYYPSISFISK